MLLTGGTDGVFMLRGGGAVFDQLSAGMTNQLKNLVLPCTLGQAMEIYGYN